MYSIDKIQFKQFSPILGIEVPIRELYKSVAALIADHTDKSEELKKSWGDAEMAKFTAISNQQDALGKPPATDAPGYEIEYYNAKSAFFGLAMKDVFLSAAIKGAVTASEAAGYVADHIKTAETVELLNEIGMPSLAKIVDVARQPV